MPNIYNFELKAMKFAELHAITYTLIKKKYRNVPIYISK